MEYELVTLKNKLKTLYIHTEGASAGSVQIWFRAGSALEQKENQGIAHFLEHMFFKGTPTRPGAKIAHDVESFGGELNAFTSFDYTCYYINTPNGKLPLTVDILMDMVSNPVFKKEDLLPERDVVFEEYRRSQDNPNQYSFQKFQKTAFTGGYAHPILGTPKTIKKFTRKQLADFRKKFYGLENALLVVAGDLKQKKKIQTVIEKYKLPKGKESNFPSFKVKTKSQIDIHEKDVHMAQLNFAIQAPVLETDEAANEDLAINCLGYGETSRLYQELVLKDTLANYCSCSTMFMNKGGVHLFKIAFPLDSMDEVLKRFDSIIKDIVSEGLSDAELTKIKNQYLASKVYEKESLESYAFSLGHSYAQTKDCHSEEKFLERINKSSIKQVNRSFKNIFSRPVHLSLQVPLGKKTDSLKKKLKNFQDKIQIKTEKKKASSYKTKSSSYDSQVKTVSLKEGVSLIYRQNKMTPSFVFHAYLRGGLTSETLKTNGLYNLLSGTITKGYDGKKYKDVKSELENQSASLGSFAGKNAYGLTLHGQSQNFSELLEHFYGALLRPDFPKSYIDHEKEISLRNIDSFKKDPVKVCFKEASQIFFNKHPYSLQTIGSEDSIKTINQDLIKKSHHENLNDDNLLFTYCGDESLEQVLENIEPYLKQIPARKDSKPKVAPINPLDKKTIKIEFDREQTQIFYGIPTSKLLSKDQTYFKMISAHLSGQSSELFVEVRDRLGLCYTAQPVNFSALEGGYFGIYMASGHDKVDAALVAIKKIIHEIRDNGFSKKEFNRIKKMIEGQAFLNIQTNNDYANNYSVPFFQKLGLDFFHKSNEKIEALTYEDFQKNCKRILKTPWSTIIVGRNNTK